MHRTAPSKATRYVALLRGINVGGKHIIKMTALAALFEDLGFDGVATYIQSGNVLFSAAAGDRVRLETRIEDALSSAFKYESRVVAVSQEELKTAVDRAPKGFGENPAGYRYDVIFLKRPLTAAAAITRISTQEGVDSAAAGEHVLYFSRLIAKASQSRLTRVTQLPEYRYMTIRNWNTVTKLLGMMDVGPPVESRRL